MFLSSQIDFATRRRGMLLRAALLIGIVLALNVNCFAQTASSGPTPVKPAVENKPMTADERAELLKLIRSLQERVDKLEAAQYSTEKSAPTAAAPASSPVPVLADETPNSESPAPAEAKPTGRSAVATLAA